MRERLLKGLLLFRLPIHSFVSPPFDGLIIAHIIVLINRNILILPVFLKLQSKKRDGGGHLFFYARKKVSLHGKETGQWGDLFEEY